MGVGRGREDGLAEQGVGGGEGRGQGAGAVDRAQVEQQGVQREGVGPAHRAGGLQDQAVGVQVAVQVHAAVQHLPAHRAVVALQQQRHLVGVRSVLETQGVKVIIWALFSAQGGFFTAH